MLRILLLVFLIIASPGEIGAQTLDQESESQSLNNANNSTEITFDNSTYTLLQGTYVLINWTTTLVGAHHIAFEVQDLMIAEVLSSEVHVPLSDSSSNITAHGVLNVSAMFLGYNTIKVTVLDVNNQTLGSKSVSLVVLLSYQNITEIFTYILGVFLAVVYVHMGATIDLKVVKGIVKKPIGPLIGILCHDIIMPLTAFGFSQLFFPTNPLMALGMFLNGSSPGGGASNMWTYLLGGSLDLSIMMTFVSTIVAFGSVPMWVRTMGPRIAGDNAEFVIPYGDIALLVAMLLIPCFIGILIQKYLPKVAAVMHKTLAMVSLANILFVFSFGAYANRYVFRFFNLKTVLAGFILPIIGYLIGMTVAAICRLKRSEIIAIGIETGIQNTNIAIFILKFTLGSPAGDLGIVVPAATVIMTPIPLLAIYLVKVLYTRFKKSGAEDFSKPTNNANGLPPPANEPPRLPSGDRQPQGMVNYGANFKEEGV